MLGKRSSPEKKDEENHDQNMGASQEIQSDGPGIISPFKKRRPDEIPQENIGAPLLETAMESHLKLDDKIPQKNTTNTDDELERKYLGSSSRCPSPDQSSYLSKTLTWSDLTPKFPTLNLDVSEARTLAKDPDVTYHPPYRYKKNLMVVDEENRQYNMQISNYIGDRTVKYWVRGDWEAFVRAHNLKAGDEITFYESESTGGWVIKVGRS